MSPSPRTILLAAGWVALAVVAAFFPALFPVWSGAGVVALAALALDSVRLLRVRDLEGERDVAGLLSAGEWSDVRLRLVNRGKHAVRCEVHDHAPASFEWRGLPEKVALDAGQTAEISYRVYPTDRGAVRFEQIEAVVLSPFALWRRRMRLGEPDEIKVYPNFRAVARFALLATDNRTSQLGVVRRPRRGEGLDFHQLREYRQGDSLRQIDWKATARLKKAISREYADERDQQIIFLIDCGGKMHARDDDLSHFDHALNAVLLLSHVALKQGDAVGLLTFSGERRWLAPRKGTQQLNAIVNRLYDLQTSTMASDYLSAAQELAARVTKRALVILVTNARDEDSNELALATKLLSRTHLVLCASVREVALDATLAAPVRDFDGAVRVAATHAYLAERKHAHEALRKRGVLALDVEPDQLPIALVNGYHDIKARNAL